MILTPDTPTEPIPLSMITDVAFVTDQVRLVEFPAASCGEETEKFEMTGGPGHAGATNTCT
jgi:hypothetical protein